MVKRKIKEAIERVFGLYGYELVKKSKETFEIQRGLIQKSDPVIFDIGAATGGVTEIYRKLFPLASIHSFEPFPSSFELLSKAADEDARIFCYNRAVSDREGTATLNSNSFAPTNSLLATDEKGSSFWGEGLLDTVSQVEVPTTSVDIFCRDSGISHIDILKMDVQGAEFSVLTGARGMLERQSISMIYSEIIMCPTYEGQHKLQEYLTFLDSFGYSFLDFYNPVRFHNQLVQADMLFLSEQFKAEVENTVWNI